MRGRVESHVEECRCSSRRSDPVCRLVTGTEMRPDTVARSAWIDRDRPVHGGARPRRALERRIRHELDAAARGRGERVRLRRGVRTATNVTARAASAVVIILEASFSPPEREDSANPYLGASQLAGLDAGPRRHSSARFAPQIQARSSSKVMVPSDATSTPSQRATQRPRRGTGIPDRATPWRASRRCRSALRRATRAAAARSCARCECGQATCDRLVERASPSRRYATSAMNTSAAPCQYTRAYACSLRIDVHACCNVPDVDAARPRAKPRTSCVHACVSVSSPCRARVAPPRSRSRGLRSATCPRRRRTR